MQPDETLRPPYRKLPVTIDYELACETFGGGQLYLSMWRALGALLANRAGWQFDINVNHPLWSFGLFGSGRLMIYLDRMGRYFCEDCDDDTEAAFAVIEDLEPWLSAHEKNASQLTATQLQYASEGDWLLLKRQHFRLQASWSDGSYQVTLPGLYEVSFGSTLAEALNASSEMICRLYQAPLDVASSLTMSAELDDAATGRVRHQL